MIYLLTRLTYTATVQRDYLWAATLTTVARLMRVRRRLRFFRHADHSAGRDAVVVAIAALALIGWGAGGARIRIFRLSRSRGDPPAAHGISIDRHLHPVPL